MGFFSSIGDAVGGILGAGASIFNNERNIRAQKRANNANEALQREMNQQNQENWQAEFDYTKQQNELTRQREDNAIQRQVADAESAGISPLAVAGTGGASASTVNSAPSAPEMQAPFVQAPQSDLSVMNALFQHSLNAITQDRDLTSKEKIADMQSSTQKFIAISQLENAKAIADSSNDTQLKIATNQLIELNRSNSAKEYQAKLDYFKDYVSRITDGHGRFVYGEYDTDTCRRHNEEISTRWAEFIKTLPADSLSSSQSDTTSVNGGVGVNKSGSSGSGSGSGNKGKWQSVTDHLMKGFGVDANLGVTKGTSDSDSIGQSSSVRALIKSFWLRDENKLWIPKGGNF